MIMFIVIWKEWERGENRRVGMVDSEIERGERKRESKGWNEKWLREDGGMVGIIFVVICIDLYNILFYILKKFCF